MTKLSFLAGVFVAGVVAGGVGAVWLYGRDVRTFEIRFYGEVGDTYGVDATLSECTLPGGTARFVE